MAKFHQGLYTPKNPDKYLGKGVPRYRSSWELVVFRMCDNHPAILGWGSETHRIPYKNPLTGKASTYVCSAVQVQFARAGSRALNRKTLAGRDRDLDAVRRVVVFSVVAA